MVKKKYSEATTHSNLLSTITVSYTHLDDEITFQGTRLKDNAVLENGLWVGYCYPWGYADNHPNTKEGSNFKIDWAVDSNGTPADLDQIDFVKIMTAVNQEMCIRDRDIRLFKIMHSIEYDYKFDYW